MSERLCDPPVQGRASTRAMRKETRKPREVCAAMWIAGQSKAPMGWIESPLYMFIPSSRTSIPDLRARVMSLAKIKQNA